MRVLIARSCLIGDRNGIFRRSYHFYILRWSNLTLNIEKSTFFVSIRSFWIISILNILMEKLDRFHPAKNKHSSLTLLCVSMLAYSTRLKFNEMAKMSAIWMKAVIQSIKASFSTRITPNWSKNPLTHQVWNEVHVALRAAASRLAREAFVL